MKFVLDNGPHIKSEDSTRKIMTRLLIALMPIVCFALFKYGIVVFYNTDASTFQVLKPLLMILVGIFTSYISEALYIKFILHKNMKMTFNDLRDSFSIIPGLLLALMLPINTPLWLIAFGAFMANIVGKMLFGGFGQNIFNPALIGYLFIMACYSSSIGSYFSLQELDAVASATPLTNLSNLGYFGSYDVIVGGYGSIFSFLSGSIPGAIGEISKISIIAAFIYLSITKTIKWKIPVFYVLTVFLMTLGIGLFIDLGSWYPLFHILSGGLLFGAVFMATDPVTSPITNTGQILYGITLGILTVVLRFLTPYPEGVATSILFMNLLVFLYDKIGVRAKYKKKKIIIPIIVITGLFIGLTLFIGNKLYNVKNAPKEDKLKSVEILSKNTSGNTTTYILTSKGWGLIKADVILTDGKITNINITDSSSETQWSEIEKVNYLQQVISNADDIDNLDAVSGSTKTSEGLKNIVRKVIEEESKDEK